LAARPMTGSTLEGDGPATAEARIRVTSVSDPEDVDTSDQDFTIGGGKISLTSPDGGDTWPIGSLQAIQWTSSGFTGKVKIELSRDGGTTWKTLVGSTANDGEHVWKVTGAATTEARIRVSSLVDSGAEDTSEAYFRIGGGTLSLTSPNGGETSFIGNVQTIRWNSSGFQDKVKIELSRMGECRGRLSLEARPMTGSIDGRSRLPLRPRPEFGSAASVIRAFTL